MKPLNFAPGLVFTLALTSLWLEVPAQAQITPDGTLSTRVNTIDSRNFVIEEGNQVGSNLFHSFRDFSVPTGASAEFRNASTVQNIFSRVTGGNVSNIDGLIRANGTANLFLLNPNGILFGPNARLDIGGSFIGTTANSIRFEDGTAFSATNPQASPLLTISNPIGLQMGQNPGIIQVNGNGHSLSRGFPFAVTGSRGSAELRTRPGHTLALVGGEIRLNGGVLSSEAGSIHLGAVGQGNTDAIVALTSSNTGWDFNYTGINDFAPIQLNQRALIDASGTQTGTIQLTASQVAIANGSWVFINNLGSQPGRNIQIDATESVVVQGRSSSPVTDSRIFNFNSGTGEGGDVQITTRELSVLDAADIMTLTAGSGNSGDITISALESILIEDSSPVTQGGTTTIAADTIASGNAGTITISTGQLTLLPGSLISSRTAFGNGRGGNITLNASDFINLIGIADQRQGEATISSVSFGAGAAGRLQFNTPRLRLLEGGGILALNVGSGRGGEILLNVSEAVEIRGNHIRADIGVTPSRITASTDIPTPIAQTLFRLSPNPSGTSGSIVINTPNLILNDTAEIRVRNQGSGNGGSLVANVDRMSLDGQARILATTTSATGGSVTVNAQELRLRNGSLITASADGNGSGGNINLQVDNRLQLSGNSSVSATAAGQGTGGRMTIAANQLDLLSNSQITSQSTGTGNAGSLSFLIGTLNLERGQIGVEATGIGNAGRLNITADNVVLDRSQISATTRTGQGGDVQMDVRDRLSLNRQSSISADAQQAGRSGNIAIAAPNITLAQDSSISTNVQGRAIGGNLSVTGDRLSLQGGSNLSAVTGGSGNAGNIQVQVGKIQVVGMANTEIAGVGLTPTPSFIGSGTFPGSSGRGGSLSVTGDRIQVIDGGLISAGTSGTGRAGNVTVRASDSIEVPGMGNLPAPFFGYTTQHPSRISASSLSDAPAGSVQIQAPTVRVADGGILEVNGAGRGGAGNLTVRGDRLFLDRGSSLQAEVAGGNQGNIAVNANTVLLRRGSSITTNATGSARGGNIDINTGFLVGIENSDIVARAQQGRGGNIGIRAESVIGIAPQAQLTQESDINASSQLGLDGTVTISTPDVKPDSGLIELPGEVLDSSQQIAASCRQIQENRFVITGRGGIPENPRGEVGSDRLWADLRELSAGFPQSGSSTVDTISTSAVPSTAIVEATAFHINPNGQLELVAENANAGLPRSIATCGG